LPEFSAGAVIDPLAVLPFKMMTIKLGGHPKLLQRGLFINDNFTAIWESDAQQATVALIIKIQLLFFDGLFHCQQNTIGQLIIFYVIHRLHLFAFAAKDAIIERSKIKETETMKAVMQTLLILMLASLGLTGCGQKGDLFLPATPTPVATPAEPVAEPVPTQPVPTQPVSTQQPVKQPEQQQPAAASAVATQQAQPSISNTKR
jgi:predicted small lipoprotein YifL